MTGQTLYVAGRGDVPGDHVLCGLAVTDDPGVTAQLVAPERADDADLVLAVADGTRVTSPPGSATRCWPRGTPSAGSPRHGPAGPLGAAPPRRALRGLGRQLARNKFPVIFAVLLAVAISGLSCSPAGRRGAHYSTGDVLYLGIMDLTGSR